MPARLTIDLNALSENYHILQKQAPKSKIAAVVKANAYGLGVKPIATRLYYEGCRYFFVASLEEALYLRKILGPSCSIAVLHGVQKGTEELFVKYNLYPVLNSQEMGKNWAHFCKLHQSKYTAFLQIDTGMHRLGFSIEHFYDLLKDNEVSSWLEISCILSHLANSECLNDSRNQKQLYSFQKIIQNYPQTLYSLSNSGGIFLGEEYQFDLVRPGISLYGICPQNNLKTSLRPVVFLDAPILQIQNLEKGETVSYNGTFTAPHQMTIATVELGYGDGFPRSLSNKGAGYFQKQKLSILGKICMDSLIVDITSLKINPKVGDYINFIGHGNSVEIIAQMASTIGYEILTSLNSRLQRIYIGEKNI